MNTNPSRDEEPFRPAQGPEPLDKIEASGWGVPSAVILSNRRVEGLFAEALEQPPAQRGVFLANACGHDAALLAKIAGLIAAHEGDESLMGSAPKLGAAVRDEQPGDGIGRYKPRHGERRCADAEEPVSDEPGRSADAGARV